MGRKLRKAEREALEASGPGESSGDEMDINTDDEDEEEAVPEDSWSKALTGEPIMPGLWDHFAAAALQALGPFIAKELQHYSSPQDLTRIAEFAGGLADAMMKERDKR